MTDDPLTRSLLAIGGRSINKRKQSTTDVSMEPLKSAGFFWGRKKQIHSGDTNKRRKSSDTAGAHELFLENEGFLSPEEPARPVKPAHAQMNLIYQCSNVKTSDDSGHSSSSSASHSQPRQSYSGFRGATANSRTSLFNPTKRGKRSILSFTRSIDECSQDDTRHDRSRQSLVSEQEQVVRPPSFFRRCMSIRSQGRPQTPSTPLPAYNESPPQSRHLPAPVPEFGLVPGFGYEPSRPPADLSSGAAARAAAAAQNEILATMRTLSLAEPKISRDSESGVGIEVRDRTEEPAGYEVPVVRQGIYSSLLLNSHSH